VGSHSTWTEEENNLLVSLVSSQQNPDWSAIGTHFHRKSIQQLEERWLKVLNPSLVKGSWSLEEDQKILDWVQRQGTNSWTTLAHSMPGRIAKQIRERYHNSLKPGLNKAGWTPAEDAIILQLQRQWGNKWAKIAESLPGRTDNSIKNRWNSTLKKQKDRPGQSDQLPPRMTASPIFTEERLMELPSDFF
jgi:hypothetical protein